MRVVLIFPPVSTHVGSPPAALSSLSQYLTEHGTDVLIRDFNIDFLHYFLNHLNELKDTLRDDLERRLVGERTKIPYKDLQLLLRISIPIICRLQKVQTSKLLHRTIRDITNAYFLDYLFHESNHLRANFSEISSLVDMKSSDSVLTDFLECYQWDYIDLVSFSLLSESQFPYAMLIAQNLRAAHPHIRIVVGGPYITEIFPNILRSKSIFEYFDYLVVHEGESALLEILAEIKDSHPVSHANVFSLQRTDPIQRHFKVEDIKSLPRQNFSGFNLETYKPWDISLPVYSSKGCTWCKCAFCSINQILHYREREISSFVEGMIEIMRNTGISHFQISDEDIYPLRLKQLAEKILELSPFPLRWSIQTRFYPALDRELLSLLREAGCYSIEFGLESGSKKILKKIRKGISLEIVRRIIADCESVGMGMILNCMIGFPSEEEADAEKLVAFLDEIRARHPNLDITCNTQIVKIYKNSDFGKFPTHYGIEATPYELSPVMGWKGPEWIAHFMNKYQEHLLFAQKSSRYFGDKAESPLTVGNNPWISLSDHWIFLKRNELSTAHSEKWNMDSSYLVRMFFDTYQVLHLNETMEDLVELLSEGRIRLSTLKRDFIIRYPEFNESEVLEALGTGLIILNEKGAVAFHED